MMENLRQQVKIFLESNKTPTFVQSQITIIMTIDFFCYDSCYGNKCTEKHFPLLQS